MRLANKTLISASIMLAAAMALPVAGAALAQGEEVVEAEVVDEEAVESDDAQEPVEVEPCLDASCDEQIVQAEEVPAPVLAEVPVPTEAAAAGSDGAVLSTPGGDGSEGGGSTRPGTTPDD